MLPDRGEFPLNRRVWIVREYRPDGLVVLLIVSNCLATFLEAR